MNSRLAAFALAVVARAALCEVPTSSLVGVEFRTDAVVFSCAGSDKQVLSLRSDARGESGTFGSYQLEAPEPGPAVSALPRRSRKGPSGATLDLEIVQAKGTWRDDRFTWAVNPGRTGVPTSNARLYLVNGTSRRLLTGFIAFGMRGTMTPYWSADGARVALGFDFFDGEPQKAAGCLLWAPTGPSIELAVSPSVFGQTRADVLRAAAAQDRMLGRIRAAGFSVATFSEPKKEREKSVLFVPKGFPDEQLARLKEAIGEVTVEPLTWTAKGDVLLVPGNELFRP